MRRVPILLCLLVWAAGLSGQARVTFTLNLKPLLEKGLFLPSEDHQVYVRGSFNGWEGTSHELQRVPGSSLYRNTFELGGHAGDTVAYKYVIRKGPDRFFWEHNPNPGNPDHGNRQLVLEQGILKLPEASFSYNEYFRWPVVFSQEKLQKDFRQFRAPGSRREAILNLTDLTLIEVDEGLRLSFTLPSGAYATTVLREFTRSS